MKYKLDLGGWNSVFAVPTSVVDNYIKMASGDSIKVLLFFLRNSGNDITFATIAQKTGVAESSVPDALMFWEQAGLLVLDNSTLKPSEQLEKVVDSTPTLSLKKVELQREPRFNPKEIATSVRGSEQVDFLFKQCEQLFGRPLKHNEQNMLMIITEDNGIPAECTLMLVEYCHSIGKATPTFIKKIALDWLEKDIKTLQQAEAEIEMMKSYYSVENQLKQLFEMNSAFGPKQKEYIQEWTGRMNFSLEMIGLAYGQTLDNIGKMSFPYINKILESWQSKGYRKPSDIENDKKPEEPKQTSSFDLDNIIQKGLEKYGE